VHVYTCLSFSGNRIINAQSRQTWHSLTSLRVFRSFLQPLNSALRWIVGRRSWCIHKSMLEYLRGYGFLTTPKWALQLHPFRFQKLENREKWGFLNSYVQKIRFSDQKLSAAKLFKHMSGRHIFINFTINLLYTWIPANALISNIDVPKRCLKGHYTAWLRRDQMFLHHGTIFQVSVRQAAISAFLSISPCKYIYSNSCTRLWCACNTNVFKAVFSNFISHAKAQ